MRSTDEGRELMKRVVGRGRRFATSMYHTLPLDAYALRSLFSLPDLIRFSRLWFAARTHWVVDGIREPVKPAEEGEPLCAWFTSSLLVTFRALWERHLHTRPEAGRFGLKLEGAGKVRVFAIGSPIIQGCLRPLHDWLMDILRMIPMDGTYDQLRPVLRLKAKDMFSFDLKAATDLFPKVITSCMLAGLFGGELAYGWSWLTSSMLFRSPERFRRSTKYCLYKFTRGQPLGLYSSWPAFTLTHHAVVWYAAADVYPYKRFTDYAILGDDIVIADYKVAKRYCVIMSEIGGVISEEKSLCSDNGCCEFAKRFFAECHIERRDLSPLSLACILLCKGFVSAFVFKTLGCSVKNSFRLRGGGYRVLSRVDQTDPKGTFRRLSTRWKRHWLTLHGESGLMPLPLEMWLGFPEKNYLTPYERGVARSVFLEALAPKDLNQDSLDAYRYFLRTERDGLSERLLVSLVAAYGRYLTWYWLLYMDPTRPLSDFLRPPVCPRRLTREPEESILQRYGLIFRIWDRLRNVPMELALDTFHIGNRCVVEVKLFRFNCQ